MKISSFDLCILLFLFFNSTFAAPLVKRVNFNYVWDVTDPAPNQEEYESQTQADFEAEMQGVYDMARVAADFIANDATGARSTTFGYYFGHAPTQLDALDLRQNYLRLIDLATNNRQLTIRFTDRDSTEHPGAQAYTTASGTINIYLPRYNVYTRHSSWAPNPFEVSSIRLEHTESRSLILFHELMHVNGIGQRINSRGERVPLADCPYPSGFPETNDPQGRRRHVYGEIAANRLVMQSGFAAARTSAENVALFAFSKCSINPTFLVSPHHVRVVDEVLANHV